MPELAPVTMATLLLMESTLTSVPVCDATDDDPPRPILPIISMNTQQKPEDSVARAVRRTENRPPEDLVRACIDAFDAALVHEGGSPRGQGTQQHASHLDRHLGDLQRILNRGAEREQTVVPQVDRLRVAAVLVPMDTERLPDMAGELQSGVHIGDQQAMASQDDDLVREQVSGNEQLRLVRAEESIDRDRRRVDDGVDFRQLNAHSVQE